MTRGGKKESTDPAVEMRASRFVTQVDVGRFQLGQGATGLIFPATVTLTEVSRRR
jgi:hypothetical protein